MATRMEVEAAFIVRIIPGEKMPQMIRSREIDQHYLRGKGRMRRTVNLKDKTVAIELNKKWRIPGRPGNLEWEVILPKLLMFDRILFWIITTFFQDPTCVPMTKTRRVYEWKNGMVIELDTYDDPRTLAFENHDGTNLHRLEVEVPEGYDLESVRDQLPRCFQIVKDVTGDPNWSNSNMSRRLRKMKP